MNPTLGGTGLIQAAMAPRMAGMGPTSQISPASPSFNPQTAPVNPMPMPNRNPMAGMPAGPTAGPLGAASAMTQENPLEKIILQSLTKRLDRMNAPATQQMGSPSV